MQEFLCCFFLAELLQLLLLLKDSGIIKGNINIDITGQSRLIHSRIYITHSPSIYIYKYIIVGKQLLLDKPLVTLDVKLGMLPLSPYIFKEARLEAKDLRYIQSGHSAVNAELVDTG